jgi:amidase
VDELVGRPATELAALVRSGEVAAVEVVRAHIEQLAAVEHRLGAFVATRRRHALEEAEELDARSDRDSLPLAGVPVAVKDVVDVKGEPTRYGSEATSAEPADEDAPVVAALRAAGAIVIGKTRCPELEIWGTSEDAGGSTVSPWDPTRTAGGSSGGSAAAVSAGIVPIALGSDGFGSLRVPAAACGTVGIRPGAPHAPQVVDGEHHWFGMSRFGPIATTVADAALALDVIAGTTHLRDVRPVDDGLRVAVSWRSPAPGVVVSSSWREAALEAGRLLNHAGHEVMHDDPPYDRATVQAAIGRWTAGPGAEVAARGLDLDRLQPRTRAHVAAGERFAKVSPIREEQVERWRDRLAPFFAEHDILITPAFARPQPAADAWNTKPWTANMAANFSAYPFLGAWNLADLPAIVVPLWQDGGRPLSVQVVASAGREDLVLSVAALLEAMVPWRRHAPGWGVDGASTG